MFGSAFLVETCVFFSVKSSGLVVFILGTFVLFMVVIKKLNLLCLPKQILEKTDIPVIKSLNDAAVGCFVMLSGEIIQPEKLLVVIAELRLSLLA